jgi:hypothetical protein
MQDIIVRIYKAKSRPIALKAFNAEAEQLAGQGYIVVMHSWEAGKTGCLPVSTLSTWVFKPAGLLTVTYRLDSVPQ